MPHFACYCRDRAGSAATRQSMLEAHLAHVEAHIDRYLIAGPLKEGDITAGSLLVVKAASIADARAFLAQDPYFKAGIWQSVQIDRFQGVAGDWVGGAAWKT